MTMTLSPYPTARLRRNRRFEWLRDLVAETSLSHKDLVWPLFVREKDAALDVTFGLVYCVFRKTRGAVTTELTAFVLHDQRAMGRTCEPARKDACAFGIVRAIAGELDLHQGAEVGGPQRAHAHQRCIIHRRHSISVAKSADFSAKTAIIRAAACHRARLWRCCRQSIGPCC